MEIIHPLPGSRFKVLPSSTDSGLLKASTGFICYPEFLFKSIEQTSYYTNIILYITRRGKKGKTRVEKYRSLIPFVYSEDLQKRLQASGKIGNVFGDSYINLEITKPKENILDVDSIDFLAWCLSNKEYTDTIKRQYPGYKLVNSNDSKIIKEFINVHMKYVAGNADALAALDNRNFRQDVIFEIRKMEQITKMRIIGHSMHFNAVKKCATKALLNRLSEYKLEPDYIEKLKVFIKNEIDNKNL